MLPLSPSLFFINNFYSIKLFIKFSGPVLDRIRILLGKRCQTISSLLNLWCLIAFSTPNSIASISLGFYQQNVKYFATELSEFHIQINCRIRDEYSGTGKKAQNALDPQLPIVGTISSQSINQINIVLTSAMHLLFSAANRYLGTA
jgi:hypothetical protein